MVIQNKLFRSRISILERSRKDSMYKNARNSTKWRSSFWTTALSSLAVKVLEFSATYCSECLLGRSSESAEEWRLESLAFRDDFCRQLEAAASSSKDAPCFTELLSIETMLRDTDYPKRDPCRDV